MKFNTLFSKAFSRHADRPAVLSVDGQVLTFDANDYVYGLVGYPVKGSKIEIWDNNDRRVEMG